MKISLRNLIFITLIFIIGCSSNQSINAKIHKNPIKIYNMHEHIESFDQGAKFLEALDKSNISYAVIVGSPNATIYSHKKGFKGYDWNNNEILKLANLYPNRFIAFCTINPNDKQKLNKLKECVSKGSKGVKLYSGHTLFYDKKLNYSSMYPVYKYIEKNSLPIIFHVNPAKDYIRKEFESVLRKFPKLKVICPHFCLSSINSTRFEYLMETYPNLYTDISFGFFVKDGFKRISKNTTKFVRLIEKYQDRFLFGTDLVVTSNPRKTVDWITNLSMCYRNMLESDKYYCSVGDDINQEFNGLNLSNKVIEKIYYYNPRNILTR
jgi:predicted TIM-barrel fold metal-dependent hydrolase